LKRAVWISGMRSVAMKGMGVRLLGRAGCGQSGEKAVRDEGQGGAGMGAIHPLARSFY
jgi:hypothetical protein